MPKPSVLRSAGRCTLYKPSSHSDVQIVIIWCVTLVAAVSTVTGIKMGIRRLSEVCFAFGMFLMLTCFLMDNKPYLLDLLLQSAGFFAQNFVGLMWHTDVFEKLGPPSSSSVSGGWRDRGRFVPPGHAPSAGPPDWFGDWTLFYEGLWIAWGPFVGENNKL